MLRLQAKAPGYARLGQTISTRRRRLTSALPPVRSTPDAINPPIQLESNRINTYLYFNKLFPIQLSKFDFRYLLAELEKQSTEDRITSLMNTIMAENPDVVVEEIIPRRKDGGLLVYFSSNGETVSRVERRARELLETTAEISWSLPIFDGTPERVYAVREGGKPFINDLNRFPNRGLKVEFDGADLNLEHLYATFRPFGKIKDIIMQSTASKDLPRSATIIYHSIRSATTAKYVVHAAPIEISPTSSSTFLHILYCDRGSSINYFREFISSHPRVFIPIIIALLTTTSLILFDPIREFNIEHKIRGSGAGGSWIRWLKRETYARLGFDVQRVVDTGIERDRDEARLIQNWLRDVPDTFVIVSGAKGSGKEALIDEALHDRNNVLIIDLARIGKVVEAKLISEVAASLGYWPQFAALSSLNNLIDLASIGLIGQKAGFSSDTATQLKGIFELATTALKAISEETKLEQKRLADLDEYYRSTATERERFLETAATSGIRDGRVDSLAGNGIISELGLGIEETEHITIMGPKSLAEAKSFTSLRDSTPIAVDGLPIVVIKDFALRGGNAKLEILHEVLATWAAGLVEGAIAHVIFTTDSATAATKPLVKALPTRAFNSISLKDADLAAAFNFVKSKLALVDHVIQVTSMPMIAKLGGRRTDLELLISKVRLGQNLEESVDEIVERARSEVMKTYFGEEESLNWERHQAWIIVKGLAKQGKLSYADVLFNSFKGNENAIKSLEVADLISIQHTNGRPAYILPATTVFLSAFQLLVADPVFSASNDYELGEILIKKAEAEIALAEKELIELVDLTKDNESKSWIFGSSMKEIKTRVKVLLGRINVSQERLDKLEQQKLILKNLFRTT